MNIQELVTSVQNRKRAGKTITDEQFTIIVTGLANNNSYKEISEASAVNKNTAWIIRKRFTAGDEATLKQADRLQIATNFEALVKKHYTK